MMHQDASSSGTASIQKCWPDSDLEAAIIREMESFLLELGAGFSLLARQKRIQIDEFKKAYKRQMKLYLRWLDKPEREPEEASPLGIMLCTGKNHEQVERLELDRSPST